MVLVINWKAVSSARIPQASWYVMWHCFVFDLCCLEIKIFGVICNHFLDFLHSCWPSRCIDMPVDMFFFLCPYGLSATCSVLYIVVMQVLSFFCLSWQFHHWSQFHLWITSIAVAPSTLQPLLMTSHTIHILTACLYAPCLELPTYFFCCHAVWCIHTWLYCIIVMHILGIYFSWLCLDRQSAMNSCGPGL